MRRSTLLLALAALAFPGSLPGAEAPAGIPRSPEALIPESFSVPVPEPAPYRRALARGAVAWIASDASVPMVQVIVVLPAGEDEDPPGRRGVAGLTATMLRRGGAGERDPESFDLAADRLAAEIDSFATAHRAGAVLDVGAWRLAEGLDLLFDMLGRPRFEAERFRSLRRSLADGVEAGRTDPVVVGSRAWEALTARPGEALSEPLDAATIRGLEREDLIAFHRDRWRPEEMVFAISGAVDADRIVAELNRRLAALPTKSGEPGPGRVAGAASGDEESEPGLRLVDVPLSGAVVLVGHRLPAVQLEPADRYAALVLEELAAGSGSVNRFVGRLRTDLGLVYAVDAELDVAPERAGRWLGLFQCRASAVGPALAAWREELERLRDEPIPESILDAARRAILGRLRVRFDTASGVAGTWAEDALEGRDHAFWTGMPAGLAAVSPAGVRSAARKLLDPRALTVVVVGPGTEVRESLRRVRSLPSSWRRGSAGS